MSYAFGGKNSYQRACLYQIIFVVLYVTKNKRYEKENEICMVWS